MTICQYCRAPNERGFTCPDCEAGWPYEHCYCENNGDYCPACEAWIEFRRLKVQLGRTPKVSENPYINERYRDDLRGEEDNFRER